MTPENGIENASTASPDWDPTVQLSSPDENKEQQLQTENCSLVEQLKKITLENDHLRAELKNQAEKFEREKAEMTAAAAKEKEIMEEKVKLIASFASSHLTGRLGLERRLKESEDAREKLATDHEFLVAKMQVLEMKKDTELKQTDAELGRLRRLLASTMAAAKDAERERTEMELQYAQDLVDDGSDTTSMYSDVRSHRFSCQDGDDSGEDSDADDDTSIDGGLTSSQIGRIRALHPPQQKARSASSSGSNNQSPMFTALNGSFPKMVQLNLEEPKQQLQPKPKTEQSSQDAAREAFARIQRGLDGA